MARLMEGRTVIVIAHRLSTAERADLVGVVADGRLVELGSHTELVARLRQSLERTFSGNVSWYAETVKLDLEARGLIERTTSRPETYRLK